jgi:hypothetical protein
MIEVVAGKSGRRLTASAQARDGHGKIGAGGGECHASRDQQGFHSLAAPPQAVDQAAPRCSNGSSFDLGLKYNTREGL